MTLETIAPEDLAALFLAARLQLTLCLASTLKVRRQRKLHRLDTGEPPRGTAASLDPIVRPATVEDAAIMAELNRVLGYPVEPEVFRQRLEQLLGHPDHARSWRRSHRTW